MTHRTGMRYTLAMTTTHRTYRKKFDYDLNDGDGTPGVLVRYWHTADGGGIDVAYSADADQYFWFVSVNVDGVTLEAGSGMADDLAAAKAAAEDHYDNPPAWVA